MTPLRSAAALLTAAVLGLGALTTGSAAATRDHHEAAPRHSEADTPWAGRATVARVATPSGRFVGNDGLEHDPAPWTVTGHDGVVFFGQDFDSACFDGAHFDRALVKLRALARILRRAGKRVLFSVAPNKSAVESRELDRSALPHGSCDADGLTHQAHVLDSFRDPDYISMRAPLADLARHGTQLYWHIDTHWTTTANTRYAHEVARRLDPQLARRQRYVAGTRTIVPDVMFLLGVFDVTETAPARLTRTRVNVTEPPGAVAYNPTAPVSGDLSWVSQPPGRTFPGRTLLVGDSFTYVSLESLRPLFRRGRFLWIGLSSLDTIATQLARSDTVVLDVVQRYLATSVLVQHSFRQQLRKALRTTRSS